jgi:4-hydroxybutyrate CoA-transferase
MNDVMDWTSKLSSPAEAIKVIKDNDHVVFSHAAAVPGLVSRELAARKEDYHGVRVYHMLSLGEGEYLQPGLEAHFRHVTNFAGANSRQAIAEGRADFLPCFFKDVPGMLGSVFPVDVAVIQVSPPDDEGFCSFGVSCDYTKPAAGKASTIIAEMNEHMPRVGGDNKIHLSAIDRVIPCAYPLPEIPPPRITGVEEEIGRHCASLVEDGATLQLGIGAIPDAVLLFLKDKRDLGIHTEMFSDGVVDLVEAGVITGRRKTLHPGKLVATFLMGTRRLYDFVDRNPAVELYPVDYVNDPWIIAKNDKMVSINSCIEVDLTGQVASESIGLAQFSGTGGQVDYVRGAALSRGGKSIMAMPSTAARGTKSRIVPFLTGGAAVTTSRADVDHVITEHGIARLKGQTLRQRAESLIRIAHPAFRESLQQEFIKRFK